MSLEQTVCTLALDSPVGILVESTYGFLYGKHYDINNGGADPE
jgi:hypothetical protein